MKTLIVDFDGVIHNYQGWRDGSIYGEPIDGVREALRELKKQYRIIIHSTRNHRRWIDGKLQEGQCVAIAEWLRQYKIPYTILWTEPGKPKGNLYIDDHGYRFTSWAQTLKDMPELC